MSLSVFGKSSVADADLIPIHLKALIQPKNLSTSLINTFNMTNNIFCLLYSANSVRKEPHKNIPFELN